MGDGQPVEPARNRLFLVQARCVIPRCDLGFDLRIIGPATPQLIAVGPEEAAARIDGIRATNNYLPAPRRWSPHSKLRPPAKGFRAGKRLCSARH